MDPSSGFPAEFVDHLLKIVGLLFIVFIVLIVHELGHFCAARLLGMKVQSVEIGRGRKVAGWRDKKGTIWLFRSLPLGACVHIEGEEAGDFRDRPFWQRMLTIFAGPAVNLVLPFFLLAGFYLCIGQPSAPPVIVGVQEGLAMDRAGLRAGDVVLAVDGQRVLRVKDIWALGYEEGLGAHVYKIRRDDRIFDVEIRPEWAAYNDEKGIGRAHPRYGVLWEHGPFKMKDIRGINGIDVANASGKAREILIRNFDRLVEIDLKGPEGRSYPYKVFPRSSLNPDINTPDHEDFNLVYLGSVRGNFYLRKDALSQIQDASAYVVNRVGKIAALPFQIFPIDPYALTDEYKVSGPETRMVNFSYDFLHRLSVASILIGLLNLLPLPYLDGGYVLVQGIERMTKRALSVKNKARIFAFSFFVLYLSVAVSNMDNVPGYIDSRLKKVHEVLNQNNKPQGKD